MGVRAMWRHYTASRAAEQERRRRGLEVRRTLFLFGHERDRNVDQTLRYITLDSAQKSDLLELVSWARERAGES